MDPFFSLKKMNPEVKEIYKIIRENFPEEVVSGRWLEEIVKMTYSLTVRKGIDYRNAQSREVSL